MSERNVSAPEAQKNTKIPPKLRRLAAQNVISGGLMLTGATLAGPLGWGMFGLGAAVEVKSWFDLFRPNSRQPRRVQTV